MGLCIVRVRQVYAYFSVFLTYLWTAFFDTNHVIALVSPSSKPTVGFHPTSLYNLLVSGQRLSGSSFVSGRYSIGDAHSITSLILFAKSRMVTPRASRFYCQIVDSLNDAKPNTKLINIFPAYDDVIVALAADATSKCCGKGSSSQMETRLPNRVPNRHKRAKGE